METKKAVNQLADSALFSGLTPGEIADVLGSFRTTSKLYGKGDMIMSPDSFERGLAYVLSGKVMVQDPCGLALMELDKGTFFAIATLFNDSRRYIGNIYALKESEVIFFEQDLVRECIVKYPQFALNYVRHLHGMMNHMHYELAAQGNSSPKNSLISYLWNSCPRIGERFKLEASYSSLAKHLNMSRSTLYRTLDELEGEGLISRNGRYVTLNRNM